jgi:PREDICTED: similar to GA21032-PA
MLNSKRGLKEKIVQLYEAWFSVDLESLVENETYWNEFFLLKPNCKAIESLLFKLSKEELNQNKNLFSLIFTQSVLILNCDNYIRIANSLVTLFTLSKCLIKQSIENGLDPIEILIGAKDLEVKLQLLKDNLCNILIMESPQSMKSVVLKIYSIFLTSHDDINQNPFIQYLVSDELFDAFISLLANSLTGKAQGYATIMLITISINFRKNKVSVNECT